MKRFTAFLTFLLLFTLGQAQAQIAPSYRGAVQQQSAITNCDCINSIQQVSITIGTSATSNTATISAVGANAFIVYQGYTTTDSTAAMAIQSPRVALTNTTTVTAFRNTSSGSQTVTVKAVVIDPKSDLVDSVQTGTVSISSATSGTATITSTDLTRSAVFYLGNTVSTPTNLQDEARAGVQLTNATTVTATTFASSTATVGFFVVQFKATAIASVNQYATSKATGGASTWTQTISNVNTANTLLAYGGVNGQTSALARNANYVTLTNGTTLTYTRNSTTSATVVPYTTVIEFKNGIVKSLQGGNIALASVTSNTGTITSVNTNKAFANFTGYSSNATTAQEENASLTQTSATVLTAAKNTAGSTTSTVGYQEVEFN